MERDLSTVGMGRAKRVIPPGVNEKDRRQYWESAKALHVDEEGCTCQRSDLLSFAPSRIVPRLNCRKLFNLAQLVRNAREDPESAAAVRDPMSPTNLLSMASHGTGQKCIRPCPCCDHGGIKGVYRHALCPQGFLQGRSRPAIL